LQREMRWIVSLCLAAHAAHAQSIPWVPALKPAAPLAQQCYLNSTLWSWGGSVAHDPSDASWPWHVFVSTFVDGCGLDAWTSNSQVLHGVGKSPMGPFQYADVPLPVYHHNPQVVRHTDGTWLLYALGMTPQGPIANCSAVPPRHGGPPPLQHGFELVELWYADSLYGPWTLLSNNTDFGYPGNIFNGTNPSPWVLPDGSVVVASHGGDPVNGGGLQISRAPNWGGPYTPAVTVLEYDWPANITFEDPFLWQGADGLWRVLLHQYNSSDTRHQYAVGGYAQSATTDVFGPWQLQPYATPVYTTAVPFADGSQITYARRERPKLVFNAGTTDPIALITAVCPQGTDHCYTLSQAFMGA